MPTLAEGRVLDPARERLAACLAAYRAGDVERARTLALSAYLDGVEPVEPMLAARDAALLRRIEAAMARLRADIGAGAVASTVAADAAEATRLFDQAETALQATGNATAAFLGSYTILVREGLEALLIVIGMIAFLRRADRRDTLPWVHAGWIGALVAWGLLRLGMRLPIGKFFSASSVLIAVLAVVLAGKGVAALQEAGWIGQALAPVPRIDWLGVSPSWQSLLVQLAVAAVAIAAFAANLRGRAGARP
jgi:high-affinity Fe2+/Pb2+ permease